MESLGSPYLMLMDGIYYAIRVMKLIGMFTAILLQHHRFVVQTDPNLSPSQGIFVRFEHVLYEHDDPGCR